MRQGRYTNGLAICIASHLFVLFKGISCFASPEFTEDLSLLNSSWLSFLMTCLASLRNPRYRKCFFMLNLEQWSTTCCGSDVNFHASVKQIIFKKYSNLTEGVSQLGKYKDLKFIYTSWYESVDHNVVRFLKLLVRIYSRINYLQYKVFTIK